jgi:hypothetical protein
MRRFDACGSRWYSLAGQSVHLAGSPP